MATEYSDKEHGNDLQAYKRRDADQTEGGSVHLHDAIQVDHVIELASAGLLRTIRETAGVTTIAARVPLDDTITFSVEEIDRVVKPVDHIFSLAEEISTVSGFGSGDFGQGGFGGA